MIATLVAFLLIGYLPGAAVYRLPLWNREHRAALDAEERVFWHITLSITWSLSLVLAMAAAGVYHFQWLLGINAVVVAALGLAGRRRLAYGGQAARPTWMVLLPLCLVVLGLWRFWPVSEYIIGGKDPGAYINEGIQIAQRGTLVINDAAVANTPPFARDLFFPSEHRPEYYSSMAMGFFIQDPATGRVVGQFPHLFPASIALGYGLNGVTGARETVAWWGLLGLMAVYFLGARLFGRWVAGGAAILLSLHVVQVWFARYPNNDIVLQAGLFAALLAFARAHQDHDRFFGPVAAWIIGLQVFSRIESLIAIAVMAGTVALLWAVTPGERLKVRFLLPVAAFIAVGLFYMTGIMRAYFWQAKVFLVNLPELNVIGGAVLAIAVLAAARWARLRYPEAAERWPPTALVGGLVILAVYAYLFRHEGGRLAKRDADSLRTFVDLYLWWPVLVAGLAGLVFMGRRGFWRDPAFVVAFAAFSLFFFYKIRIVDEHFWMARRFLAISLPGTLLLATAAALGPLTGRLRGLALARPIAGAVFLVIVGQHYAAAAAPVIPHVEYRNMIPYVERLAARFTARDLIIMESRNSGSDIHVLGLPLSYIYAKEVLVLNSPRPDRVIFPVFLEFALKQYERVFYVGTGGTTLLSRQIVATPVASDRVQIDEFEVTLDRLPSEGRRKEFDYGVYQLTLGQSDSGPFDLDIGVRDDLHVLRFHAKEEVDGRTIRWTQRASEVALSGLQGTETEVALVMSAGARPPGATPARVRVLFNGEVLGDIAVGAGFEAYVFAIPPALAAAAAASNVPATLRLESTVWSPREWLGGRDTRELGVMMDAVRVR